MSMNVPSITAIHAVKFTPSGRSIDVPESESILSAALANGCVLPHNCRNGVCGTCKAKLISGEVDRGTYQAKALSDVQREQGWILTCQARPLSGIEIEAELVAGVSDIPVRRLVARVQSLDLLANDVMRIRLRMPSKDRFRYLPGQYINFLMNGGLRRSVSAANVLAEDDILEFHLRNYGGPFSRHVFEAMKVNDLVRLEGPLGTFFIREESDKPIIFLASGTGFAPIKAMIEEQVSKSSTRPMRLYWGGRRPRDLYHSGLAQEWMAKHGVQFVPVVSDPLPEDAWTGRTGFVHRAVMDDHPDLSGYEVYACGAPVVVDSARDDFVSRCGLAESNFYADMFAPGASAPSV